jgi:hypothetical protein
LDETTALLFGRAEVEPPSKGVIAAAPEEGDGGWVCCPWPYRDSADASWLYAAVLTSSAVVRCLSSNLSIVDGSTGAAFMLPSFDRVTPDLSVALAWLESSGYDTGDVAEFLVEALLQKHEAVGRTRAFLLDFLEAISHKDGFVEVLGATEGDALLLQGWSAHLQPGSHQIILVGDAPRLADAVVGAFVRSDIPSEAAGIVILAEHLEIKRPENLDRVYYRTSGGYFRLDALSDHCSVLGRSETAGHLRKILPDLTCDAAARRHFERTFQARFQGEDTVATLTIPVRLATDFAVHAPGAGFFLSGWLLDPERRVRGVYLKSTHNFYRQIDGAWVRRARPDVGAIFETDAAFRQTVRPADDNHGLMIFVPHPEPIRTREKFYLEVAFNDGATAFRPIVFEEGPVERQLELILSGAEPSHLEIDRLIRSHVGPIAAGLVAARRRSIPALTRISFGDSRLCPSVSVLVPVRCDPKDIDVLLACFSRDPDFADVELIFVAHRPMAAVANSVLSRQSAFYGLAGELLIHDEPLDRLSQLELAMLAAEAPRVLLMAPSVLPRAKGWLNHLIDKLAALPAKSVLSPTLIYEDFSIRYAGYAEPMGAADTAKRWCFAGVPQHLCDETKSVVRAEPTLDCCLMSRGLCQELGGVTGGFVGGAFSSRDFANRLRQAGGECYWAPQVSLYALDDHVAHDDHPAARLADLIDRWSFDRKWTLGPPMIEAGSPL